MDQPLAQFCPYKGEKLPSDFCYDEKYEPLAYFFNHDAKKCMDEFVSKVLVIRDENKNFVGFVAFTIKGIEKGKLEKPKQGGKHQRPAIVIGQLLIDNRYRRKGYGRTVIRFSIFVSRMINRFLPCRLLIVEAFDDESKKYWMKNGFEPMPDYNDTLVLDLRPMLSNDPGLNSSCTKL